MQSNTIYAVFILQLINCSVDIVVKRPQYEINN